MVNLLFRSQSLFFDVFFFHITWAIEPGFSHLGWIHCSAFWIRVLLRYCFNFDSDIWAWRLHMMVWVWFEAVAYAGAVNAFQLVVDVIFLSKLGWFCVLLPSLINIIVFRVIIPLHHSLISNRLRQSPWSGHVVLWWLILLLNNFYLRRVCNYPLRKVLLQNMNLQFIILLIWGVIQR